MKVSQFTDYSLRTLLFLGLKGDRATVVEIAAAFRISSHHLVKVVHRLSQDGYIRSFKGKGGGLELARDPDQIRIGDFVKEREPFELVECFNLSTNMCPIQGVCGLERALYEARSAFLDSLNKMTLGDFLKSSREKQIRMRRLLHQA